MHEIPLMDKDRESSTSPALTARNMNPHPSSFSPRPHEYPVGGDKRLPGNQRVTRIRSVRERQLDDRVGEIRRQVLSCFFDHGTEDVRLVVQRFVHRDNPLVPLSRGMLKQGNVPVHRIAFGSSSRNQSITAFESVLLRENRRRGLGSFVKPSV